MGTNNNLLALQMERNVLNINNRAAVSHTESSDAQHSPGGHASNRAGDRGSEPLFLLLFCVTAKCRHVESLSVSVSE